MLNLLEHHYIIHHSRYLIVASRFVKEQITKFYPQVYARKIMVIHNPIAVQTTDVIERQIDGPYVLSVNSFRDHKNLITLIKAFELISEQVDHSLVLVGKPQDYSRDLILQYIAERKIQRIVFSGYVSDAERNNLYRNAALFVSPSLHEGFGMTPVEAALFEIPVLTTRETSIPEVTRDLLYYYEPATDEHRLAARMLEILLSPREQEKLVKAKRVLSEEYDIRKIATQYCEFFRGVAHETRD
jgi:glycosyltransferase involved in cell wall biosynthesis